MTQALTTTNGNQAVSAVSVKYNEADIQQEMGILRAAFPKLDAPPEGLRALIIAARFSGLNPFRGEIYYVPKVGITVASKIKAADAIAWAQAHGNTLNIRFEKLTQLHPEWQQVNPQAGDVCWLCIIVSSKQRQEYFNWRIQVIDELKALGYKREELEAELNKRCGTTAPETRAVGIVKAAEDFGDKFSKAQVFTRDDRAQKRALQKALNIGGFASPDMRQYGGVRIEDERPASESTVESNYRVVDSGVSGAVEMPYAYDDEPVATAARPTQAPPPAPPASPAEIVLKPVSNANRTAVSQLLDRRDALAELGTTKGATMTDDEKHAFVAAVSDLAQAVNVQLTLRELQTFKLEGKVSERFKAINNALNGLMDYDAGAPREGELTVENAQP